jgi:phosphoribosylaminoimidazolecarboxamide formyltransferase / IMP cyclohydrolase
VDPGRREAAVPVWTGNTSASPDPALQPDEQRGWLDQLDDVALASDGYIPFRDNIDQAARHGVRYVADPGGSTRNHEVEAACAEHNIVLTTTEIRLFLH